MNKPRIIIADDHTLMTEGLRRLLEPDFQIIGTVSTGLQLIEMVDRVAADAIVLDIGMPELNGIEAARVINKSHPAVKLIFVTQQIDRHYIQAAFQAGAAAFVAKQSASTDLRLAILGALRGESYITSFKGTDTAGRLQRLDAPRQDFFGRDLTMRQREVLQLTAEGKTVKEIGLLLKISPKTVEFHKSAVMDQLGLRNTAELTRYALAHGIINT